MLSCVVYCTHWSRYSLYILMYMCIHGYDVDTCVNDVGGGKWNATPKRVARDSSVPFSFSHYVTQCVCGCIEQTKLWCKPLHSPIVWQPGPAAQSVWCDRFQPSVQPSNLCSSERIQIIIEWIVVYIDVAKKRTLCALYESIWMWTMCKRH